MSNTIGAEETVENLSPLDQHEHRCVLLFSRQGTCSTTNEAQPSSGSCRPPETPWATCSGRSHGQMSRNSFPLPPDLRLGKTKMVAVITVMRKLLTILNIMLKKHEACKPPHRLITETFATIFLVSYEGLLLWTKKPSIRMSRYSTLRSSWQKSSTQ